ncbi:MAG: LPS assembly protein LptD, partial [Betaproteobacteria bacterium]|nr:LPS assembly protein LptD [Betaproteobacteria bacterium]
DSALQYDTNNNLWKKFSAAFRYQPERGKVMNIGYRYQDESLKTVDVSAQWPLGSRWTGLARWNYSLFEHEIVEGLAGLEYNADCWAVRAVAHKFATATQAATTTFFLQLEFTGLAGLGSNPLDVLRQSITGYAKTNEINRK